MRLFEASDCHSVHLAVVPLTLGPGVLLALAALDVGADRVGTLATAVRADHLAAADLVAGRTVGALEECGCFLAVGEDNSNISQGVLGAQETLGVVLVGFEGERSGFLSTAGSTADGAALVHAVGAVEIAGLPGAAGVGVTREWLVGSVIVCVTIEGGSEVAFLTTN